MQSRPTQDAKPRHVNERLMVQWIECREVVGVVGNLIFYLDNTSSMFWDDVECIPNTFRSPHLSMIR